MGEIVKFQRSVMATEQRAIIQRVTGLSPRPVTDVNPAESRTPYDDACSERDSTSGSNPAPHSDGRLHPPRSYDS
jgi:hypothetical protein